MKISRKANDVAAELKKYGVNHNLTSKDIGKFWGSIEAPVRISETRIFHDFEMGAFSYVTGGFLYHTHMGRYCSLSNGLHIGQGNHPIEWMSTHPFQYQTGLFDVGDLFEYKDQYEADKNDYVKLDKSLRPNSTVIGNDVWISHGVYVKSGVSIGDGSVIGARSVITRDIPPYAVVVGSPGKILKYRFPNETIQRLLKLKWWRFAPWQLRGLDFSDPEKAMDGLEEKISKGMDEYSPKLIVLEK